METLLLDIALKVVVELFLRYAETEMLTFLVLRRCSLPATNRVMGKILFTLQHKLFLSISPVMKAAAGD